MKDKTILKHLKALERLKTRTGRKVTMPIHVAAELYEMSLKPVEHFAVITLDGDNRVIDTSIISMGTVNRTMLHARDVFRKAILDNAAAVIVAHNHPSGKLKPSSEDDRVTDMLKEAGTILAIQLLDHVIVSSTGFYSYQSEQAEHYESYTEKELAVAENYRFALNGEYL
jgi:DNA repair protein RadC